MFKYNSTKKLFSCFVEINKDKDDTDVREADRRMLFIKEADSQTKLPRVTPWQTLTVSFLKATRAVMT